MSQLDDLAATSWAQMNTACSAGTPANLLQGIGALVADIFSNYVDMGLLLNVIGPALSGGMGGLGSADDTQSEPDPAGDALQRFLMDALEAMLTGEGDLLCTADGTGREDLLPTEEHLRTFFADSVLQKANRQSMSGTESVYALNGDVCDSWAPPYWQDLQAATMERCVEAFGSPDHPWVVTLSDTIAGFTATLRAPLQGETESNPQVEVLRVDVDEAAQEAAVTVDLSSFLGDEARAKFTVIVDWAGNEGDASAIALTASCEDAYVPIGSDSSTDPVVVSIAGLNVDVVFANGKVAPLDAVVDSVGVAFPASEAEASRYSHQ